MKRYFLPLLLGAALLLAGCGEKHETLLLLGNVITMDEVTPAAEAVFVKDGIIEFVGTADDARKLCDGKTVVKDYGTASIYPGFLEAHTHGVLAADRFQQVDLTEVTYREGVVVMDDYVQAMKQFMDEHPGMPMYKGAGWNVKEREPNAAMLDAICPDVPMFLNTEDGHSMWINTAAMKMFGIDAEAARKYGTDCVRVDADGNPTGYLSENPAIEILGKISMSKDECKKGLLLWQERAFSYGFTGVTEAGLGLACPYATEAYQELCDEGVWKLRTYANLVIDENVPDSKLDSALNNVLAMHKKHNGEYFRIIGTKMFMDGVIEAHTGWLEEAYTDQPGYYGLKRCPESSRVAKVVAFNNLNGMNVHFHTIGDAAVHTAIEGISQAVAQTGVKEGRNALSHLQVVDSPDFQAFADNGIIPVVAPLWTPRLFPEYGITCSFIGRRADTQYPVKSFSDLGCKVNFHSDYPISSSMSAARSVYTAVTRTLPYLGEEGVHNASECITREQALQAMTTNVAYQWREEDRQGSIAAGKLANFAVFDANFLKADLDSIWDAEVKATYVDGKLVYGK
ncbi:MAG: amidohydrolase [Bacteroidales bacterium]|nr:amidohydrolase [Candidatus Cryptobacteroides equifaecalis]